jgi:dienelactone hydrolase
VKNKSLSSILFFITIISANVNAQQQNDFTSVSPDVKYQYIGTYDVARLNSILTTEASGFSDFSVTYSQATNPVKLYRVLYNSVIPEFYDKPTVASGLIAIPETVTEKNPVVSYQHGTVFTKTDVPSFPEESMETRLMIAQFAGQGYILIAADYFGKGSSTEPDSYQIKGSTQQACLDMMSASYEVFKALKIDPGQLFLSGWSMGSWSTLLFLEKLESLGFPVVAAATACTPTDIYALVNRWMHAPKETDAIWLPGILALQLNAYEIYYQLPGLMESAVNREYQQATLDFYQNKISFEEFYSKTPNKVVEYLKPEFIESGSLGDSKFWQLTQDNNCYRWRSQTPLNLYYGDSDEAVPEYIATLPVGYQQLVGGAQTISTPAGKLADHRGTFKFAVEHQKGWFDGMLE